MSRPARDQVVLASGYVLLGLGLAAWWATPVRRGESGSDMLLGVWLAAGVLTAATWWRHRDSGSSMLISAFGLAVAAPLAVVPVVASRDPYVVAAGLVLASLAVLPVSWALAGVASSRAVRRLTRVVVLAIVAAAVAISAVSTTALEYWFTDDVAIFIVRWTILAVAVGLAALVAALATLEAGGGARPSGIPIAVGFASVGIAVSAAGLALAVPGWPLLVGPVLAVAATAILLGFVAIRPLEMEAGAALAERDLVVAASDAERYRMASALHDGPLGDLALLVYRLEAESEPENARLARSVIADLRALGNELRLPILDDLGAGPAMEWLVERLAQRSQTAIEVDMSVPDRPPADVEHAVYRIAQEALLNAVKHGRGPVRLRYVAAPDSVSLSVDDAGPGLDAAAPGRAVQEGRLGLLLMKQRAEAIGARLVLEARISGGTHVGLTWNAGS